MAVREGQLPREIMLAHLNSGRSVLISPVYGKNEKGETIKVEEGFHATRPHELPNVLDTVVGDPAKLAAHKADLQAKLDATKAELDAAEKAQAELDKQPPEPAKPLPSPPAKGKV